MGVYWGKNRRTVDYLLMSGGATVVVSCAIDGNCCVITLSNKTPMALVL